MNNDDATKDLNDNQSDHQLLLGLRHTVGQMFERMLQMQNRTNPLPPNYEERFAALETAVAEIKTSHGERLSSLERIVAALERSNREIVKELRMMREDYQTERNRRLLIEDCVDALERMAA